jgi:ubiquinone/menaquinone biosynthesis C-methylase UbiE
VIGWLYDLLGRGVERGEMGERRRELLSELEGEVLEIGAGTGFNLPHYERASRVVAVEPNASMAKQLQKRIAEAAVPVELRAGSAESLPFADESFDTAVLTFVLCSVKDPATALREVRRVLRPGGRLVVLEHVRGDGNLATWQGRLTPIHRKVAGNCHLDRDTRSALAEAGFETQEVEDVRIPGSHPLVRSGIQGVAIKTSS